MASDAVDNKTKVPLWIIVLIASPIFSLAAVYGAWGEKISALARDGDRLRTQYESTRDELESVKVQQGRLEAKVDAVLDAIRSLRQEVVKSNAGHSPLGGS